MILKQTVREFLKKEGQPPYRQKQIMESVFKKGICNFLEIAGLPLQLREKLGKEIELCSLSVKRIVSTPKGDAAKFLLETKDGHNIETVLMKFKDKRNTVCVSSQIGCRLGCRFCATGRLKFGRNLSTEEICDQVLYSKNYLAQSGGNISNIVFMGMGEPFMNYENVMRAVNYLNDPDYFGIGARNITISTAGIAPGIKKLAEEPCQVNLAVSLHAPDQSTREKIMPVAKIHSLDELMEACDYYVNKTNRRITYEYVMLKNINDNRDHALALAELLKQRLCHVNLIPYNATDIENMEGSPGRKIEIFKKTLMIAGIPVTVRVSLGQEIYAACGQLANKSKS